MIAVFVSQILKILVSAHVIERWQDCDWKIRKRKTKEKQKKISISTVEQKIWIVQNYSIASFPTKIKREFCKKLTIRERKAAELSPKRFMEVFEQQEGNGKKCRPQNQYRENSMTLWIKFFSMKLWIKSRRILSHRFGSKHATSMHLLQESFMPWKLTSSLYHSNITDPRNFH